VLYRAKWIVPIAGSPLEDGAVLVHGGRIEAIGPGAELAAARSFFEVRDLGDAAILPGFVNTHSHLELTVMRGLLEEADFREWIMRLTDIKLTCLSSEDLLDSARLGALESIRSGVTSSGDTCDSGFALDAMVESGMRGVVFQEIFGPAAEQADESLAKLEEKVARLVERVGDAGRVRVGVSPHAPYTVSADLFARVARLATERGLRVAIHAAESEAEERFVRAGEGPFAERLRARGIEWNAPGVSTIAYLERLGVLEAKPLVIHAVRATDEDLDALARSGSRIAHCPKSNAKFGHGIAPLAAMREREIAVGLGSDSVASNNVVDLLDEARAATLLARAARCDSRALTACDALELATIGGARALGLDTSVGTLEAGKRADLCAVSLEGLHVAPVYDVETALVFSATARDVVLTVVDGRVVFDRDGSQQTSLDEPRLMARLGEIRAKIGAL
jgi:5-methylthioadenosine/S-adenosylhomocysteine deaminase